jgi:hypothetical protein
MIAAMTGSLIAAINCGLSWRIRSPFEGVAFSCSTGSKSVYNTAIKIAINPRGNRSTAEVTSEPKT